jgi:uncharacterized membrane protein
MPENGGTRFEREGLEFGRAVAFFDATYALALTLLVTTLDVGGEPSAWTSLGALDDAIGSQFIAFLISFAVIAAYWLHSHRILSSFTAIDMPLIVLNLLLVATIILIPFTTEAMGDERVSDFPLPTVVYAVNIACAALLTAAVYALARRRGLVADRDEGTERFGAAGGVVVAAVFLVSIAFAYGISADAARWSWLSLVVLAQLSRYASRLRPA